MTPLLRRIACLLLAAALAPAAALAAQREPIASPVDPELEKLADHNLEVGRFYYAKKKAYRGAKDRLLDVVAAYPEYTKIDEVYFILGQCSVKLGELEDAREFFERLLAERSESDWAPKARAELEKLPKK